MPKKPTTDMFGALKNEIISLTEAVNRLTQRIGPDEQRGSCDDQPATKRDLRQMEERIMAKLDDLVTAASALSTASDGLSVKVDDLVTKIDKVLETTGNADLPPAAETALAALKASRDQAVATGAKVDAEVLKLDGVLPTPAPAAPLTPDPNSRPGPGNGQ